MKVLTIISIILLPINLVASIFGMNTPAMPFIYHPNGFWMILSSMLVLVLLFMLIFKRKGWL
jgi:Mg2+ and Co2+ transporter CorA